MTRLYFRNEDNSLGCAEVTHSKEKLTVDELLYSVHESLVIAGRDIRPPILVVIDEGVKTNE